MLPSDITALRHDLALSQAEFAQLFGAHAMTVSKWERGILAPSAYQQALMDQFRLTADRQKAVAQEKVKNLLVGAGVVAALLWLLSSKK